MMISYLTKQKLLDLLSGIAQGEYKVIYFPISSQNNIFKLEQIRQELSLHPSFEVYTSFKRLDRRNQTYLTALDIEELFLSNDQHMAYSDCSAIVRNLDTNKTGFIEFQEYSDMILPKQDVSLNRHSSSRASYYVAFNQFLELPIEMAMVKLFQQIARNAREYDYLRSSLRGQLDYSITACFNDIDVDRLGYLDLRSVTDYIRLNRSPLLEAEILAFIQFADANLDQKVEFWEFESLLLPGATPVGGSPAKQRPELVISPSKRYSPSRVTMPPQSYVYSSQLVTSQVPPKSTYIPGSPGGSRVLEKHQEDEYKKMDDNSQYSEYLQKSRSKSIEKKSGYYAPPQSSIYQSQAQSQVYQSPPRSQVRVASPLRGNEEEYLMGALKNIVEIDRELVNMKTSLSLRPDFNLQDCFRLFDVNQNESITQYEFEMGLNKLGLYPTKDEIYLFYKKFDEDRDGVLQFGEFTKVFYTPNRTQVNLMQSRPPSYVEPQLGESHYDIFAFETQRVLKNLIQQIFQAERTIDNFRSELQSRPLFNIYDAFKSLDLNNDGTISYEELKEMLRCYGIFTTENDMQSLMQRFDKDKDGTIKYTEFAEELAPKSPPRRY